MDRRLVIFHRPGPAYDPSLSFREQPGIMAHPRHYATWLESGKLEAGGPFLDNSGGMMIPVAGLPDDEIRAFAETDPTVRSGLLRCEFVEWFVAMKRD